MEPYKEALIGLFQAGATYETLAEWLLVEEKFKVSVRSLKRVFSQWEVGRRLRTGVTDQVKAKIQYCFFINNADDDEILDDLAKEGWHIGKWTLVRLRYELGLKRRIRGAEAQAEADRLVQRVISEELQAGSIDEYGREMMYAHFKSKYHAVQRDRLFRNYRMLNPEAVERRRRDTKEKKENTLSKDQTGSGQ